MFNEDPMCGFLAVVLGVFLVLLATATATAAATLAYAIVGTYNERQECQHLGIPLYRCQARSYRADIDIKESK